MTGRESEGKKKDRPAYPSEINRRLYARFPVRLHATITDETTGKEMAGEILDIGMGGALIRAPEPLRTEIRLSFELQGIECVFDAYVVRIDYGPGKERLSYGVEFHPNPAMERRLKGRLPPR